MDLMDLAANKQIHFKKNSNYSYRFSIKIPKILIKIGRSGLAAKQKISVLNI